MTEAVADRVQGEARDGAAWARSVEPQRPAEILKPLLPFAAAVALALLLHRYRGAAEVGTEDRIRLAVARLGDELAERAWKLGRDPKAERRKRRAWSLLQSAVGAGFTVLARRAASGVWEGATGDASPRSS
jgi:hypothetical protein